MKKNILTVLVLLLFATLTNAEDGWTPKMGESVRSSLDQLQTLWHYLIGFF